jgi:hypothetical protein
MKSKFLERADAPWLIGAVIAAAFLVATIFVPLWKMELVAPQYPAGLKAYAYGHKFADDPDSYYDDVREINGLNHYIGMKPIGPVTEMKLFIPGVLATAAAGIAVSFIAWKRKWFRALIIAAFWILPGFFVVDLQYWLHNYGHTMNPEAALNTGDFTPKVFGSTTVWNFHSETGFEIGFYLMVLAAVAITFLPLAIRWFQKRRPVSPPITTSRTAAPQAAGH